MAAPAVAPGLALATKIAGPARAGRVLLYDGVCNLCNNSLHFIAKRDPNRNIMFCSIQSDAAQPYLQGVGMTRQEALRRLLFIEYKDCSEGSTAALRVVGYMRQPWPLLKTLLVAAPSGIQLQLQFVDRDELLAGTCRKEIMEEEEDDNSSPPK